MSALCRPRRPATRFGFAAAATVLVGVVPAVHAFAATTTASPPSPAAGHAEVIAQSVIVFDGGDRHWAVVHESVAPDAGSVTLAPVGPSFLAASGGVLVVGEAGAPGQLRLASGEATFLAAGGESVLWAAGGAPSYYAIELVGGESSGDPADSERSFSVGQGSRDVDLVRDVISSGETLTISESASVPVLVVVTDGAVNVAGAATGDSAIGAGEVMLLDGALAITTIGAEPAAVIAVVIGPLVEPTTSDVASTTSASGTGPSAGTTAGGTTATATTSTAGSTSTMVPATSTSTTGSIFTVDTGTVLAVLPTLPTDFDGDGLTGAEEAESGTNPNLADTDGDGLGDGKERDFGSSPLIVDRDGDGLNDYWEWSFGTHPNDEDSDDDGVWDGAETAAGTNPNDPNSQ